MKNLFDDVNAADLFITSDVSFIVIDVDKPTVEIHIAEGNKCERCWKILPEVKVEDICKSGDPMKVKLIKIDDQGRLDFSRKALLPKPEGWTPPPPRRDNRNSSKHNRPFKKRKF